MIDPIDRQAAIDALGEEPEVWSGKDEYEQGLNNQWHYDVIALKALPSAQPEPCEDAVSRAELLSAFPVDDEPTVTKSSLRMTIKHLPSVTPKEQRWIPCSKKSPEEKEAIYWVCTSGGYQCQARWTDDKFGLGVHTTWGWHFLDCPQYDKITAWMPLPEPYRGEGE